MNKAEAIREARVYQEPLEGGLPKYRFPVGTTIYCFYGRCELCEEQGLVGEQQPTTRHRAHNYRALTSAKVYSFNFQGYRVLSKGRYFKASKGRKIS